MTPSYYLDENRKLIDNRVLEDIDKAKEFYENGDVAETHDILMYIVNAIRKCTNFEDYLIDKLK